MNNRLLSFLKKNKLLFTILYPIVWLRRKKAKHIQEQKTRFFESTNEIVESGSLVVKLPVYRGSFEIGFHSSILKIILVYRDYESEIAGLIEKYIDPEKDALDVGANVGFHSVLLARLINSDHRVLAFEPTPNAIYYLKNNLKRNDCEYKVIIYEGIASDADGIFTLNVIEGLEEYSSVGSLTHPYTKNYKSHSVSVKGNTIDNLVTQYNLSPGFIKIDTEGSEYSVFKGAEQTIRTHRPVIISELSETLLADQKHSCSEIFCLLYSLGYNIIDIKSLKAVQNTIEGNFIAIPYAG
jgi:FkbM family methyltransferase